MRRGYDAAMSDAPSKGEPTVELPVNGCVVHEIWFWGTVRMHLVRDDFEAWIDFASGTCSFPGDAAPRPFNTEREVTAVHWLVDLWRAHTRGAAVTADGSLRVEFENSAVLTLRPEVGIESWSYSESIGHHVIALPGGGVAHWGTRLPGIESIDGSSRPTRG